METIINEKNPWDGMVNVVVVGGPTKTFVINEVDDALGIKKNGKASKLPGIVKEHLSMKRIFFTTRERVKLFLFISVMDRASYRGSKLVEHGKKVVEKLFGEKVEKVSES